MSLHVKARRVLSFSRDEWRVRSSQLAFRSANWLHWKAGRPLFRSDGHLRSLGVSAGELSDWWRSRRREWFADELQRERVRRYFDDEVEARRAALERAEHVLRGRMPIFSHPPVEFDSADRWSRDPILGVRCPDTFYGSLDYLDVHEVGDSKYVWEPNRFAWVYWLGQAAAITDDDKYARKFRELTLDWLAKNRYPVGVNFCSALEMALRAYALVWASDLFACELDRDGELLDGILHAIWVSCRHIESNLSHYFAPNTHLMGEAFGLFACGAAFREFREAARWREQGQAILVQEASGQIHADGMHRELSSCYQLYAADFYVQASLISRRLGFEADPTLERTALLLARRVRDLAPLDLRLPQFNDCDGGRLTGFCLDPLDAAPTLAAAHALDPEFVVPPALRLGSGYSLWMSPERDSDDTSLTPGSAGVNGQASSTPPDALYDSGVVTYKNAAGDYLLFRSGSFGYRQGDYSHSHDAPTSFVLHLAGVPLVVDSGTGAYTQSVETRNAFRSARGKNVLLIGGKGPSTPAGWFSWNRVTDATLTQASWFAGGVRFCGQYATRDGNGSVVDVSRSITLFDEGVVAIATTWRALRPVSCQLSLTLHPDIEVTAEGSTLVARSGHVFHFDAFVVDDPAAPRNGGEARSRSGSSTVDRSVPDPVVDEMPFSPDYGLIETTQALTLNPQRRSSGTLVTLFSRAGALAVNQAREELAIANESRTFAVDLTHAGSA